MTVEPFGYHRPTTLEQALELLAELDDARVLAGGTDLLGKLRAGRINAAHLISLTYISPLSRVDVTADGGLRIGATARVSQVGAHPEVAARYPALAHACSVMATVQIRNMGTVVGNVANASPCADSAGPLLVYGAEAELVARGGRRRLPLEQLFGGPGQNRLAAAELIEALHVPPPAPGSGSAYLRLSARSRVDMAAASASAYLRLEDERVVEVRLAIGAVAPTPLRCRDAEQLLGGQRPSDELLEQAAAACMAAARPIDDVRAPAAYRRAAVRALCRRVLEQSLARAREDRR